MAISRALPWCWNAFVLYQRVEKIDRFRYHAPYNDYPAFWAWYWDEELLSKQNHNWLMQVKGEESMHKFSGDESGACVIHIARHFDGGKLKLLLAKHNVSKTKMDTLHECMKLHGNSPQSPMMHYLVLAPSDSAYDA
ncbi:hypothetical protein VPH35_090042 [Triticum aestivum]